MLKSVYVSLLGSLHLAILSLAGESLVPHIPTHGLVAYYPFDGNAQDVSGNGNHATVSGAIPVEDKFENSLSAYYLDGVNDHMIAPVNVSPSFMPQVTMVVWAKADQKKDRIATILSNAAGSRRMRALSIRPSLDRGCFWATSTKGYGSWVWEKVETGKWTFLALSYDQFLEKLYLYVDDSKYEANCTQADGKLDLTIGMNPRQGEYFRGYLDEIRIYDRVLNGDEIAALYHQFRHGKNIESGMEFTRNDGRRGLLWVFIVGFALFATGILAANIMIRRT